MSGMAKMVIVLSLICLGAALGLAGVYALTKGPIAEAQRQEKIRAIGEVMPEGVQITNDPLTDVLYVRSSDGHVQKEAPGGMEDDELPEGWRRLHVCRAGDDIAGLAMEVSSDQGYSGTIKLIVGLSIEGEVLGVRVLEHKETPGLGAKITQQKFLDRVIYKDAATGLHWTIHDTADLKVTKDGGRIDAISGATISPRAVCGALRSGYELYAKAMPAIENALLPQEPEPEPQQPAAMNDALEQLYRGFKDAEAPAAPQGDVQ